MSVCLSAHPFSSVTELIRSIFCGLLGTLGPCSFTNFVFTFFLTYYLFYRSSAREFDPHLLPFPTKLLLFGEDIMQYYSN